MKNSPDRLRVIDSTKLRSALYFQSLLEEAHSKELLHGRDMERIQYECIALLADTTKRYNGNDSSSIRVEKAQDIMASILFTLGVALKTYPNPDDAVSALQQIPIKEIFKKGRKRIDTLLSVTRIIHAKLLHQLIDTQNRFYRDTFIDGISGFFKLYYPEYAAQEIHITADYPLYNPQPKLLGIEFIKAYVEAAYYENQFCSYFAADDIHRLLRDYAEGYQDLLINIYEQVLTAAMGCILVGADCSRLDITEAGARHLSQKFTAQPKSAILATIADAAEALHQRFQFPPALHRYIQNSLPLIAGNIAVAAKAHTINRIFYAPAIPKNTPKITFSFGEKMDDALYRKILAEIGQCRYMQDKMAIIKEHIHSLADLEDVLLDAEFTSAEIGHILCELRFIELAALAKKYRALGDAFALREPEQALRNALQSHISALPQAQQDMLEQAGSALQEEA